MFITIGCKLSAYTIEAYQAGFEICPHTGLRVIITNTLFVLSVSVRMSKNAVESHLNTRTYAKHLAYLIFSICQKLMAVASLVKKLFLSNNHS